MSSDERTDTEKAAAVDRIFREAGFEFIEDDNEETVVIVAPLLRSRREPTTEPS